MAKEKKKSLGIKTTRYFTKSCVKCDFEYPNWFTNCPKCGAAWDETESIIRKDQESFLKKTIKIVVKITEEDFDDSLERVLLIFSADHGKSWYQMRMDYQIDYFIAEIAEVPIGSTIIYYIEVTLKNGEKVVENNEGKYFFYKVGATLEETEKQHSRSPKIAEEDFEKSYSIAQEYSTIKESPLDRSKVQDKEYFFPKERSPPPLVKRVVEIQPPQNTPLEYKGKNDITIFGKPQTQVDPNLKLCPYCNSKIKKMWSTCPICGKNI
ncbi:MAG: hypothetical protein ACFE85_05700 [Candidatus Hodarchaeota archaeon]